MKIILLASVLLFYFHTAVAVQEKSKNHSEAYSCLAGFAEIEKMDSKKILIDDFFKLGLGLAVDDYNLYDVGLKTINKNLKEATPDVKLCKRMTSPNIANLVAIKRVVVFANENGSENIKSLVQNCIQAVRSQVIYIDERNKKEDEIIAKESMALSNNLINVVKNLNPKIISEKETLKPLLDFKKVKTDISFNSPEFKKMKIDCALFLK